MPFTGADPQSLLAKRLSEPVHPLRTTPDVPEAVEQVVMRSLTRVPADRYASAAVLPFADLSAEGDQEYFSEGLTDELITSLSRAGGLQVAARTSSFQFKGRDIDVREVGRRLHVGSVLESSVPKSGDPLRISGQLVSARDGYQLWADAYVLVIPYSGEVGPFALALAYTGQGDLNKGFEYLNRAIDVRDRFLPENLFDPLPDRLRADPRFGRVEQRMGVPH